MRYAAVLLVTIACSGAFASQPGQPLDCSDWVFLEPGLWCEMALPAPCTSPACSTGASLATDSTGDLLYLRATSLGTCPFLSGPGYQATYRYQVIRVHSQQESVIAQLDERCGPSGSYNIDRFQFVQPYCNTFGSCDLGNTGPIVTFNGMTGTLFVPARTWCMDSCSNPPGCTCAYPGAQGGSLLALRGFATTFDVLQTYTPSPATLGFRVPYMPEGMGGADHFDTYWGDLATVGDWSKAKGLQCGYPATPPHVGDYFSIADTLATPAPGSGYYYGTATTYQGQTRYGRKTSNGHLSGRDPAVLPACAP